VFEFETDALADASGRVRLWGVTLPAWAAFSSLHAIDEGVDRGSGQAWYRAGTLGRYTLQRVATVEGRQVQPQFDDMLVVAPPKLVVATFPA
jgi:hypothetical protein